MEPEGAPRALADDLRFVHRHLDGGGHLRRLDCVLVVYRHHGGQLSHATPRALLVKVRRLCAALLQHQHPSPHNQARAARVQVRAQALARCAPSCG